jgi:NADPH:quinone reductase-like Zn-dependent oxidoreductase
MKAAVYEKYGPAEVVEVKEFGRPQIGDRHILVQIFATQVTTADWRFRASKYPTGMGLIGRAVTGFLRPRNTVLGSNFAGRVVAIGSKVTRFRLGDEVFGACGAGAHAEYLAIADDGVVTRKPAGIGYAEAAATPFGAMTALAFVRDFAKVVPGQKVLVTGASGGVGVFLVQLARHFGAEVAGLTTKPALVRSLGADRTVDYRHEDYAAPGAQYDFVFDTAGATTFAQARRALKPGGAFVPIESRTSDVLRALFTRFFGSRKVLFNVSTENLAALETIANMLAAGTIMPVIDEIYPLERIVDAHRRVEGRRKSGAVIVAMNDTVSPSAANRLQAA